MADSGIGSDAQTLTPGDSVSQVSKTPAAPTRSDKQPAPKRPSKAAKDKDAPPGAVQVQAGGQRKQGKPSPVVSATIPLSGWGELDLCSFRKDIEPTFSVDARPYADLVDADYRSIQARYSSGGKHIPFTLFRYYCFTLWWYRVIWLHKSNGNVLNTEQKNFLSVMSAGGDYHVPSHIAQYLANMGNFTQGSEQFYFRMMPHALTGVEKEKVAGRGWFQTDRPDGRVDAPHMWTYSQLPSPGVSLVAIRREADLSQAHTGELPDLSAVQPEDQEGYEWKPTDNVIGWNTIVQTPHHSSWRSTFASLGWLGSLPPDLQTQYAVSTSTMKWVSERLATLTGFKTHLSSQVTLSVQGHPMQAYWLGTEEVTHLRSKLPSLAQSGSTSLVGSTSSSLAVLSRFAIDAKVLAPSFAFGYRLERSFNFKSQTNGNVELSSMSNYQPWIEFNKATGSPRGLNAMERAGINAPLMFGSQAFLNVRRFATHELNRSVGLDAAIVLSDTR